MKKKEKSSFILWSWNSFANLNSKNWPLLTSLVRKLFQIIKDKFWQYVHKYSIYWSFWCWFCQQKKQWIKFKKRIKRNKWIRFDACILTTHLLNFQLSYLLPIFPNTLHVSTQKDKKWENIYLYIYTSTVYDLTL
jgi:hypothetical protein